MKELTEIYEQMREAFAQEAGFVPSDNCDAMVRLYALSAQVQSLLAQADWVLDQSFPQTAQGEYLDYHAQTRGITRAEATKARGVLCFSASGAVAADCVIAAGTVAMTAGGVKFETTERVTMPKMLAKGFRLEVRVGGAWRTVFEDAANWRRLRKVAFDPVEADALRLVVTETWGGKKAHVFAMDAR